MSDALMSRVGTLQRIPPRDKVVGGFLKDGIAPASIFYDLKMEKQRRAHAERQIEIMQTQIEIERDLVQHFYTMYTERNPCIAKCPYLPRTTGGP